MFYRHCCRNIPVDHRQQGLSVMCHYLEKNTYSSLVFPFCLPRVAHNGKDYFTGLKNTLEQSHLLKRNHTLLVTKERILGKHKHEKMICELILSPFECQPLRAETFLPGGSLQNQVSSIDKWICKRNWGWSRNFSYSLLSIVYFLSLCKTKFLKRKG